MALKHFDTRIQWKRDTSSNWTSINPVLLNGEIIIVDTDNGDIRFKIGDGVKTYTQLPFEDEAVRNLINTKADKAITDQLIDGSVRHDITQKLTEEQKAQARINIGAYVEIANNLTTSDPSMVLSAAQGVVLKGLIDELDEKKESVENKSTELTAESTDEQYPSAKAVYDALSNITIEVDTTLTEEGKAAEAKSVGEKITLLEELSADVAYINEEDNENITDVETGGVANITVDSALSTTSTNPVQNKVITKKVSQFETAIAGLETEVGKKQPKGNYALKSEIPNVPVQSVNGQTGIVSLNSEDVGARSNTWMPTADEVGADVSGTADSRVSAHNVASDSHNDIRLLISGLTTRLNALANSTDEDLDQMAEIVEYIKSNKGLIDGITTSKVSVTDIIDNLTTNVSNKPLSAKMGVELKALIDDITVPTKVSELQNDAGYITAIPSEYITETELNNKGYLTQHQDLSAYAKKSEIPAVPVQSVNGKTGAVTLSAADVGAATGQQFAELSREIVNAGNEVYILKEGETVDDAPDGVKEIIDPNAENVTIDFGQFAKKEDVNDLSKAIADLPNNKTLIGNVAAEVPIIKVAEQPQIVSSIDDMTDTSKLYVMDGYIYQYREITITVEGGTVPNFDNLMDDSRTVIKKDERYSKSNATWKANTGYSGIVIPYTSGTKLELRLKNYTAGNYPQMYAGNTVDNLDLEPLSAIWSGTPDSDGVLTITTTTTIARSYIYFVLANDCIDDVIITLNQPITYTKTEDSTETVIEWVNTGLAFVPADYEERIIEAERDIEELKSANNGYRALGISEVFAPSPQLPADGSEGSDFNGKRESITAEQIYTYINALLNKYPRYITKEVMGKDASGTYDWNRYICCRRAYDAWQTPNYPPMYAWVNGATVIYSVSVSPRIGDTLYTTAYIGTAKGTVSAVSNANQSRTVGGVVYTRDKTKDVEPTLVYTETGYSPYFSSNYAGSKNGIYNGSKSKISTISSMSGGTLTGANSVSYTRYPLGDRNSDFEEIPAIVIGANEHGTGGDPATPAMISARMIKDLCECKNADNPLLNLLKNEYMMVFCPVINPWGFDKSNQKYYNSNGVNIDRNFDTPGWKDPDPAGWDPGEYGGSENETQYFMNTLVASKTKIAMANHSYGEGLDSTTGEAVSGGICSYMMGRNDSKYAESLLQIAEVMAANYNLVFTDNGEAKPEDWGKTRSYISWIGAEGGALEMNSRDGFITDPNNEAKGAQFTARVMDAAYTELLQFLYMLIDKQES